MSETTFTTLRQLLRRGSARLLVLNAVSSQPMHGYEVAKQISAMFEGTYIPRSGVIYPTLQSLEDLGYVKGSRLEDKTVYTITESGKEYLKKNEENLKEIISYVRRRRDNQEFSILRSAARLQRTIVALLPELSKGDKGRVAKILDDANEKVMKMGRQG
jgi:DNA-binding PadR family transcriptional regulator